MRRSADGKQVFSTDWFRIIARNISGLEAPYYVIQAPDCVCVIAVTVEGKVLLVQQDRATLNNKTLEFPSGHIEKGEKPLAAAHRELLEETGYRARRMVQLGVVATDTGRLGNRLWCYWAAGATYDQKPVDCEIQTVYQREPATVLRYMRTGKMIHSQDIAAFFLALSKKKLHLRSEWL
jgi:8-oxo-dGTP pyrophosphatase MutT (NUDIX family)